MQNLMQNRNRSVMSHDFSKVPHADIQRSSFKRSHGYKTTFDSGHLIPILVDEALPGDTFQPVSDERCSSPNSHTPIYG